MNIEQILTWADEHHIRTGKWPKSASGAIPGAPGESWKKVNKALSEGLRSLPGRTTLAKLISQHRGVRSRINLPLLSEARILRWARSYKRRHGDWPKRTSGLIPGSHGETWGGINMALRLGRRGLPGGSSLPKLLDAHH
jgi:hypothetical protein